MTPAQKSALEGLVGRALTAAEIERIEPHLPSRNDVAITAVLSEGRVKHSPTQIGPGTIVAVMGEQGGPFLDAVTELGVTNRNVYWGMDPVRRGAFDLSVKPARDWVGTLKEELPDYADGLDKLLQVGVMADPFPLDAVSRALNIAEGYMTL